MAAGKTNKKAKSSPKKSAAETAAQSADSVVIDGTAEEVKTQSTKAKSAPKENPKSPQGQKETHQQEIPQRKIPRSAFAIVLGVIALGIAGWSVFISQNNLTPDWQNDIDQRLTVLEQAKPDDQHLARQNDLAKANNKIDNLNERLKQIATDLEIGLKNATQASVTTGAAPVAVTDETIAVINQDIQRLNQEITALRNEITALKTASKTQALPIEKTDPPGSNAPETEPINNAEGSSWWQSLFGSIRISRLSSEIEAEENSKPNAKNEAK